VKTGFRADFRLWPRAASGENFFGRYVFMGYNKKSEGREKQRISAIQNRRPTKSLNRHA
jgi:hypothetical protein